MACHIPLERSWWGLQLCFRLHLNQRSAHKIVGLQSFNNRNFGNFRTPTWEYRDKSDIWVLFMWSNTKNTIRGKVVASPKLGPWWVLWIHVCPWLVCAPKVLHYALTNLLFGLCMFMWIIEPLVTRPSLHLRAPTHPSTFKVLWAKERVAIPFHFVVFTFRLVIESIKELWGVSINLLKNLQVQICNSVMP